MSPKSKTRKKKSSGRRREEQSPYAPLLASAAALQDAPSPLMPEMWASELLGSVWLAAWQAEDDERDDEYAEELDHVVASLGEMPEPAALTTLRALSGVGEKDFRKLATEAADKLAAQGVTEPAWYDPDSRVEFVEAHVTSDLFGDLEAVAVAYRQGAEQHTIIFFIQSVLGISAIELFRTPEEGVVALLRDMIDSTENGFRDEIRQLTAEQAWESVQYALDDYFDEGPDEEAEAALLEEDGGEHPAQHLAFAQARMDLLVSDDYEPVDHSLRVDDVVESFLASPEAQALPDRDAARLFAEVAANSAVGEGLAPDQFGPLILTACLVVEFAAARHLDDADLLLFPDIVRAWAYFTADSRGLPQAESRAKWDEMLPLVIADFEEAYRDPELAEGRTESFRA